MARCARILAAPASKRSIMKAPSRVSFDLLLAAARKAARMAYAPYSRFPVGAALEIEDGRIVTGCNIENASYGLTICAERVALGAALAQGFRRFKRLAIVAPRSPYPPSPCGACRQVLAEFVPPGFPIAMQGRTPAVTIRTFGSLWPLPFVLKKTTRRGRTAQTT